MAAKRKPALKSIRDQIAAEDRKMGEEYTFPTCGFTVRIKAVGSHMMLMGGLVPEGYDVKKYTQTLMGEIENPTPEHLDTLNQTMIEVVKESVRLGWSAQYDDFVELMLPRIPYEDLQDLFTHLMNMEGIVGQGMFPKTTDSAET